MKGPTRLLVVCLGNICRSPMAEGALRARIAASPLAGRVEVDSAGTGDWHAGEPPDRRAIACARGHGVDIRSLRARQLRSDDVDDFDLILCADPANVRDARAMLPRAREGQIQLWLPWAGVQGVQAVPDPYTGGPAEFERAWELVDDAAFRSVARLLHLPDSGII